MAKFIEVTEIWGAKVLLNVEKIMSVFDELDGVFIEVGLDKDGESIGISVSESYAEIKNKIQNCEV